MMEKRAPSSLLIEKMALRDHTSTFDKMANHVREMHSGDVSKNKKDNVLELPKVEAPKPYQMHTFGTNEKGK
jgi:hypothetical protein